MTEQDQLLQDLVSMLDKLLNHYGIIAPVWNEARDLRDRVKEFMKKEADASGSNSKTD